MDVPGDEPVSCISQCLERSVEMIAMNKDNCFCLKGGTLRLEDRFSEGEDVLTVLDASKYMPKTPGRSSKIH